MLALNAVLEAAKGLLGERFPGEARYTNQVPKNFTRPSFLVEGGPLRMADADCGALDITAEVKITCFTPVDAYYNSDSAELIRRMTAVQELFAVGYLRVGDRALHVVGNTGEYFLDFAEVTVALQYQDDRPGAEDWPLMGEAHINIKEA